MKHLAILIFLAGSSLAYSQTQQAEQVCLSMVLIRAPETDTPAQVNEARHKAEQVRNSAQKGTSFSDLARANSKGVAAAEGGALGCFKRGTLSRQLEDRVFNMQAGEVSEGMHTKQVFVLFYVTEHRAQFPPEKCDESHGSPRGDLQEPLLLRPLQQLELLRS